METKTKSKKKILLFLLCAILLIAASVLGTLAYLTSTPDSITNTFTFGKVAIDLTKTSGTEYKIIPGISIDKDPTVTVKADSEECYLFVKLSEGNWPAVQTEDGARKVGYVLADGWESLGGENNSGIYTRKIDAATAKAGTTFPVLKDNAITVHSSLTQEDIESITGETTLTATAYAIQSAGFNSAEEAWTAAAFA